MSRFHYQESCLPTMRSLLGGVLDVFEPIRLIDRHLENPILDRVGSFEHRVPWLRLFSASASEITFGFVDEPRPPIRYRGFVPRSHP